MQLEDYTLELLGVSDNFEEPMLCDEFQIVKY